MNKKKVFSWTLYDWANSAFATTVMAGFFPIFFEKYWANNLAVDKSTFYLGLSNSIGSLIVAMMAPFLGAISDTGSIKKKLLFTFAFLGILSTSLLWFVEQGEWQLAAVLYAIGAIGFASGNIFYDSLLPAVAKKPKYDFVSSLGYSMGYLGGGVLFVVNALMFEYPQWFGIPDSVISIRLAFVTVAVWWAVFSIPIFLFVPEPSNNNNIPFSKSVKLGWVQLKTTFSEIKQMKVIGLFLLSYWLYMDGVDTIIRMASKLALSMGFTQGEMIKVLIIVQLIGFPAGLLFNWFSSVIKPKNAVLVAIFFYTIATGSAYFIDTSRIHFYAVAGVIGLFQGGIQAISRSLFARLVPKGKEGEFFGFYNMLGKFSAVLGPLLLGTVTWITGEARMGLFAIVVLFIGGGLLLYRVDFDEGERIAKKFTA